MRFLLGYRIQTVNPKTICTQTLKTNSTGCIYIFEHIYVTTIIAKETINLTRGMEGLRRR